jgi:hypothetical protein
MERIFEDLLATVQAQAELINSIKNKMEQLEWNHGGGGGGGTASIEDYESGKEYKRNMLIVDPNTETVYRALSQYISDTVENDCANGYLKLVGFEGQVLTFAHNPTSSEIETLPDDTLVAVYNPTDTPYVPET